MQIISINLLDLNTFKFITNNLFKSVQMFTFQTKQIVLTCMNILFQIKECYIFIGLSTSIHIQAHKQNSVPKVCEMLQYFAKS